jgi:hypothetical protein
MSNATSFRPIDQYIRLQSLFSCMLSASRWVCTCNLMICKQ